MGSWCAGPHDSEVRAVLASILKQGWDEFSERDLWQNVRRRFKEMCQLSETLAYLVETGYFRPRDAEERTGPGRKPSPIHRIHKISVTKVILCIS